MAWFRVDPRFLRQSVSDGLTVAYVSHGERDTGHLTLFLDSDHEVAGFELAYDRFLGNGELYFTWDRSDGRRTGDLDTDGRTGSLGPGHRMAALVRYRRLSAVDLGRLLGYVERHADPLAANHRDAVIDALRSAMGDSVS